MFFTKPTKEQDVILKNCLKHPVSVINAFAGTGKTSTLLMLTEMYKKRKFLYLAYNKSIEIEAREKFDIDNNVEVKTTHALAYYYVSKYTKINLKNVSNLKVKEIADRYNIDYNLASFVSNSFNGYCNSGALEVVALPKVKSIVKLLLNDIETGSVAPTFDFILKKFHLLLADGSISIKKDILLLDEGQDTNDVVIAIFHLIFAKNKIIVGDKHQQIYSFRGSKNALDKINGEKYYLTESFRFNKRIAKNANLLLSMFKGETIPLVSKKDDFEEFDSAFKNPNYSIGYISRNNTTLVKKILILIKNNYEFITVRNPNEIFRLILDVGYICEDLNSKVSYQNKYLKKIGNMDDLLSYIKSSKDIELGTAIKIYEKYGLSSIENAYSVAKQYFNSGERQRIALTTAHSSKGLEWDIVVVEDDFFDLAFIVAKFALSQTHVEINNASFDFLQYFINNIDKADDDDVNAINLLYVAFTRAKKSIKIYSANIKYLQMDKNTFNSDVFIIYKNLLDASKMKMVK